MWLLGERGVAAVAVVRSQLAAIRSLVESFLTKRERDTEIEFEIRISSVSARRTLIKKKWRISTLLHI